MRFIAFLTLVLCLMGSFEAFAAKPQKKMPIVKSQVMSFEIMRANKPACEPNCPEWIFATGEIVPSTPVKFNQILSATGKAPLLLVIQSGGGDVRAAMAMGRLIRARQMNVAVGYAFALTCASQDVFCNETLKPKQISRGFLSTQPSYCASACTLVLAAGVERIAIALSVIGTHQIINKPIFERIYYREKYLLIKGKKKIISKTITKREIINGKPTTKMSASFDAELDRYVKSMGVGSGFLDYYAKAPPSGIYKMTPEERLTTKIITSQLNPEVYSRPEICMGVLSAKNCVLIKK